MDVIAAIHGRRSVRSYDPRPVPRELIENVILDAAQTPPPFRGQLPWAFNVIEGVERIAGYGAPGKGNTLLNYCGIRTDFLEYTVDRSPHKQGRYTPGTHIPILAPEHIMATKPDYVLILPWNLKDEIMEQQKNIRAWGGRFVVPIPRVEIL